MLLRVDLCWALRTYAGHSEAMRGAWMSSKGLLLALRAGEVKRVSRSLITEAAFVASQSSRARRRAQAMVDRALHVAQRLGPDPYLEALAMLIRASTGVLCGELEGTTRAMEHAEASLRRCPGATWEVDFGTTMGAAALYFAGRFGELDAFVQKARRTGFERDNLFLVQAMAANHLITMLVVHDDVAGVRTEVRNVPSLAPGRPFSTAQWAAYAGPVWCALYTNDIAGMWEHVEAWRKTVADSLLLHVVLFRVFEATTRGYAAAAAYARSGDRRLGRIALRLSRVIERSRFGPCFGNASVIRAVIARAQGDDVECVSQLRLALKHYERLDQPVYSAAVHHQLARLLEGPAAGDHAAHAVRLMKRERVRNFEATARLLCPLPR